MSGKYGEAIGKWKLEVGGFNKELTPKKGDARRLLNMFTSSKQHDESWLFEEFTRFMKDLISREYPFENESEENELDMFIEYNLIKLLEETQIAFRFAKREDIEKLKKDILQTPEKTEKGQSLGSRSQGLRIVK